MSPILPGDDFDDDPDDDLDDDDDVSAIAPAPAPSTTPTTATTPLTVAATPSPSATIADSLTLTTANSSPFASGSTLFGVTLSDTVTTAAAALANAASQNGSSSSGLSTGGTADVVIGVLIPVLLIAAGLIWYTRRNRKRKRSQRSSGSTAWGGSTAYGSTVDEKRSPPGDVDVSNPTEFYGIAEVHGRDMPFEAPEAPVYELSPPTPVELEGDGVVGNGSREVDEMPSPLTSGRSPIGISPVGTVSTVEGSSTPSPIVSPVENRTVARKAVPE